MSTNTTRRLLPVGIQDFADIRRRGFVYVDKTARAHGLITGSGKQFFLSRPRRFGVALEPADDVKSRFKYLIEKSCESVREKAAVIIDEFDNPLLDAIRDRDTHTKIRFL